VLGHLGDIDPSDVGIPLLVHAELLFGAERSARKRESGARIQRLTVTFPMLPLRLAIVRQYVCVRALGISAFPNRAAARSGRAVPHRNSDALAKLPAERFGR